MDAEQLKQSNRQRVAQISKKTETVLELASKLERLADQLEGSGLSVIAEKLETFNEKLSEMPDQIAKMQSVSDKKLNTWISQVNQALSSIELSPQFQVEAPNVEVKAPGVDLSPITNLVSGIEKSINSAVGSIKMPETQDRTDELKEAMGEVRDAINGLVFPVAEFPTTVKIATSDGSATIPTTQTYNPADYFPRYGRNDIGATMPNVDPFGSLQIRGPVLTEEGMGRINFTGSSLTNSIGTATFTTGSQVVTGTGFATTYNLHQGDHVRLDGDTDYDWAQIALIADDTTLYLTAPYTGTGGTAAASFSPVAKLVGSGASLTVSNGQLTFATGTTASSETMIFSPVINGPAVIKIAASVSQRIANQDIYLGYERSPFVTITEFARFKFTGTTNTQVVCESGYNPYSAPTASETESTTVSLPNGDTTATINTYKVELQTDQVIFSINGFVVATHTKRIPHIMKGTTYGNWLSMRTVNGSTPPAGSTNYVIDYAFGRAFNRLDVSQSSPGDSSSSQVVSQRNATSTFDTLQSSAAALGNGVALYVDGMATAMFTVTGSGSWTVTFEGTEDGTNWYSLNTNRQGTDTIGSTATNATTGTYKADVSGFQYIRARVSTYASGNATVTARVTPAPSTSRVVNANITASQTLATVTTVSTLTGGGVAHDAADSGNPHKIGTKSVAQLSAQTLVAANDRSNAFSDLDGAMLTRADAALGDIVSGTASNTDGTATQVLAAGAAGIKHYITDVAIANSSAAEVLVELKDGSTTKWAVVVPAKGSITESFRTPIAGTAATAWNFDPGAATTTVYCSVSAFKSKI